MKLGLTNIMVVLRQKYGEQVGLKRNTSQDRKHNLRQL